MSSTRLERSKVATTWRLALAASIAAALWLVAGTVFCRRAAGAFQADISPLAACVVTAVVFLMSLAALGVVPARWPGRSPRGVGFSPFLLVAALGPPVLIAAALTPRYSGMPLVLQITLLLLGSGGLIALWASRRSASASPAGPMAAKRNSRTTASGAAAPTATASDSGARARLATDASGTAAIPSVSPSLENAAKERVLQQLIRYRSSEGADTLEGTLCIPLKGGQRHAVFHLPFSPPFESAPAVNYQLLSETSARIKTGLIEPYGVRLELRRTDAAEEEIVELAIHVTAGK